MGTVGIDEIREVMNYLADTNEANPSSTLATHTQYPMNEQRQQAYLELVQSLLQCENDTEADILQAHPELVDAGLVMTLRSVAQMMTERKDLAAAEYTAEWLINFANWFNIISIYVRF